MVRVAIAVEQNWNAVPGGTARSTNHLIEALQRFTTIELVGVAGRHGHPPELEVPRGLTVETVPVPGRPLVQMWNRLRRPMIDRWVSGFDVVHAPAYLVPPSKQPTVVTIHDLAFRHNVDWFTPHGVKFFGRFLEQVGRADWPVIVPSKFTADDCLSAGIDHGRVHVVPWGVTAREYTAADIDERSRRLGLPDDFVLFVGTLEPRKNLDTLVAAMQLVPEIPLVVVGPIGWGNVTAGDAIVLGNLTSDDVGAVMAAASVLVYPSHFEGFGLPVLEAMSVGTPVIVTESSAAAEVAGDTGLAVRTDSAEPLATAIRSIIGSVELRERLGSAGQHRASEFTWEAAARATLDIYEATAR